MRFLSLLLKLLYPSSECTMSGAKKKFQGYVRLHKFNRYVNYLVFGCRRKKEDLIMLTMTKLMMKKCSRLGQEEVKNSHLKVLRDKIVNMLAVMVIMERGTETEIEEEIDTIVLQVHTTVLMTAPLDLMIVPPMMKIHKKSKYFVPSF